MIGLEIDYVIMFEFISMIVMKVIKTVLKPFKKLSFVVAWSRRTSCCLMTTDCLDLV